MGVSSREGQALPWPLLLLLASIFVDMAGYAMVVPLLPFYAERVGGGATVVGLLGALYAAVQLVSVPLIGALSDRYGRRPLLALCLGGTALGNLVLAFAVTPELLVAALLLDSATGGTLSLAQAYVADTTGEAERARGMGLLGAAFGLGFILGPALGAGLGLVSLQAPALAAATLAFVNALVVLVALPEAGPARDQEPRTKNQELRTKTRFFYALRFRERRGAWGDTPQIPPSSTVKCQQTLSRNQGPRTQDQGSIRRRWSSVFGLPALRRLLLTLFLLNLAFVGLQSNFPLFSRARFGWGPSANAAFYAFVGVCAVLTQGVVLPRVQPRFGERRLVVFGLAALATGLALVGTAPAPWALYPAVALAALGSGLAIPALTALLSTSADAARQGALLGGTAALLSLTQVVAPALAGFTFDNLGIAAPYFLGAAFAATALLAFQLAGVPSSSAHQPHD
jgi:MFS transporter, DHA1 family, tetracycline resistance protein